MSKGAWGAELFKNVDSWTAAEMSTPFNERDLDQLRRRSIIAEVSDIRGRWAAAAAAVEAGPRVAASLKADAASGAQELRLERIRYLANHARSVYRRGDTRAAKAELLKCLNWLPSTPRAAGLEAAVQFYLGCALRKVADFDGSQVRYGLALEALRLRAKNAKDQDELDGTRRRLSIVMGLGLGWLAFNKGRLSRALEFITPAEVLLSTLGGRTSDEVHGAYLLLLRGSVLRAKGDYADAALHLEFARSALEKWRHPYVDRARLQLALCGLATGDIKTAQTNIKAMRQSADNDARLHILQSRLLRHTPTGGPPTSAKIKASLDEAKVAVEALADSPFSHIEALVCHAEALFLKEDFNGALTVLDHAAGVVPKLARRNPKLAAVVALNRAKALFKMGRFSRGDEVLNQWRTLSPQVEHRFVQKLGAEVEGIREQGARGFHIPLDAPLDAELRLQELRTWLANAARDRERQSGKKGEAESLLGVSRATLFNWEGKKRAK